jgi:hypothetical protein
VAWRGNRTLEVSPARVDTDELPVFGAKFSECCFGLFEGQRTDLEHAIVPPVGRQVGGGCRLGHGLHAIAGIAGAAQTRFDRHIANSIYQITVKLKPV